MKRNAHSIPALAFALTAALTVGCASTSADGDANAPWLRASPALRQQIEDQITRLPWTHGLERVEQISWFASVGEPAYDHLLELCEDPRPDVAAAAVAALGATRDSRLVEPLRAVRWQAADDRALSFERARTFVRLGDWTQVHVLIDGLGADDAWARAWCLSALREVTGQDMGFDPQADAISREQSLERWRRWHASRSSEGILAKGG
jgi:HEAT repeat protein